MPVGQSLRKLPVRAKFSPKSQSVWLTLQCVVFLRDGVARSVVNRVFNAAANHPDDSGPTTAISPSDRAKLPRRHLVALHIGRKSACNPGRDGSSLGPGMAFERPGRVAVGSRAWPPEQLCENLNPLFYFFFRGVSFAVGDRFWLVICPAGTDPEGQPDGTQMNITSINHEQQAPRWGMGDSSAHAQSDVGFAAKSGSHARSRVVVHGVAQESGSALIRPSSRPVGQKATASTVALTG